MQFTKLFSSILDSTIWQEAKETKLVWVTMLAMCDRIGEVHASIPGLAVRAGVSIAECEAALACLMSPDPYSRTKDHEGRRVKEIDQGWELLNHAKYRALLSAEERREYLRRKQQEHRAKASTTVNTVNKCQSASTPSTHAEAEAEAEIKHKRSRSPKTQSVPVAEFEEFWAVYPRKIAKGAAEKAWKTACKHTSEQTIIDATKRFADAMADQEEKTFIKHPATWLTGQCWLDELPPPAEKVCRWPYDDTDIHTPKGMALLTKTFLENQHRA
ncbi:MAG: hypothetical protein O3C40_37230 [Planctomycetota bacterium]|nr:hypothetical protein [Planctomycetota bacterium]